jgi:hypothetical protein
MRTYYIVVSDTNGKLLLTTENRYEAIRFANKVRAAGGQCTIFKSTAM